MRDVLLVARFEILRARRTWRAVALVVLYAIASSGATWTFTRFIGALENALAAQLGVAATETPGAMLAQLTESELWREVLAAMAGSARLAQDLAVVPPLALFNLWFGFLVLPFLAASAAAECVAIDVQSGAIRYEAQRTTRSALVLGRAGGQLALSALASVIASVAMWLVGLRFLAGQDPVALAAAMASNLPRTLAFGVPFVGIGVAASVLTRSPAWARSIAVSASAASWVAYGVLRFAEQRERWAVAVDVLLPVLPQAWLRGLWEPGTGWWTSAFACVGLGAAVVALAHARFAARDL